MFVQVVRLPPPSSKDWPPEPSVDDSLSQGSRRREEDENLEGGEGGIGMKAELDFQFVCIHVFSFIFFVRFFS